MAKRKMTEAERQQSRAHHTRVMAKATRTRELAERAQAKLDAEARERGRERGEPAGES